MFRINEYKALNKMLDEAIKGDFTEEHFDEREMSKFQTKFKRYLMNSSLSEKRLNEEKDKLKELITDISHQTKTPLTNIVMYSELLNEIEIDDTAKTYVDEICLHSKKLEELINALTKMSRLEVGIFQFRKEPICLSEIVTKVIEQGHLKATQRNIKIVFNEEVDVEIIADLKWVTEAVYNILDNAIKYSKNNTYIEIENFCYEMFCGIRISDQGFGISEEDVPKVFSRFYRGINAIGEEGIGVGLYLARKIVEEHGGYIKISPQKVNGTVVDIFFPNITTLKD